MLACYNAAQVSLSEQVTGDLYPIFYLSRSCEMHREIYGKESLLVVASS